MKMKVLADFQICISVPLNLLIALFTLSVRISSFRNRIFKTPKLNSSLEVCFWLTVILKFLLRVSVSSLIVSNKWEQKHRAPDAYYYESNDYTVARSL